MMNFFEEIEALTREFIAVPSINGSPDGERTAALFLQKKLLQIPYFAAHPGLVRLQSLRDDSLGRMNVFAILKGSKTPSKQAIIWHGHMDTVGTADFGTLESWAFDPDRLCQEVLKLELPAAMRAELLSGDWLMGRGSCDMKSGVCVFLVLLAYLSQRRETFSGTIIFMANPVEENQHKGIIEAIEILQELKKKENLSYVMAMNNDYICPLYEGDNKRYIYTGAAGKLLPCFYIRGQETHVGQCFEGFDPLLVGAEIAQKISLQTSFTDGYDGEYTLPPTVLQLRDLKTEYNVQTPLEAVAYFNYFVHQRASSDVLASLKAIASEAMQKVADRTVQQQKSYAKLQGLFENAKEKGFRVYTFEELWMAVEKHCPENRLQKIKQAALRPEQGQDVRQMAIQFVQLLVKELPANVPVAVVFFAAPYCPYNTLRQEVPAERALKEKLSRLVQNFATESGESFEIKGFFPSLSDSSYLKMDDPADSIKTLYENFPLMKELYPLPLAEMKNLSIPAVNYGCYGRDAHKWSERVYKPYSFGTLPKLILKTVEEFLG